MAIIRALRVYADEGISLDLTVIIHTSIVENKKSKQSLVMLALG